MHSRIILKWTISKQVLRGTHHVRGSEVPLKQTNKQTNNSTTPQHYADPSSPSAAQSGSFAVRDLSDGP